MLILCVCINTGIFVCSSTLHFYWVANGKRKQVQSIQHANKELVFPHPGKLATGLVTTGLLLFALLCLSRISLSKGAFSPKIYLYTNALMGTVFLARALRDGRYLGLFKKVKQTSYAKNDTRLSLFISSIAWQIKYKLFRLV